MGCSDEAGATPGDLHLSTHARKIQLAPRRNKKWKLRFRRECSRNETNTSRTQRRAHRGFNQQQGVSRNLAERIRSVQVCARLGVFRNGISRRGVR